MLSTSYLFVGLMVKKN